jgi:hypothetical protein
MRPEYQNLHSYFHEIKEQYAHAKTMKEKLDLLKIAREILKQAQEQVAQFQDEIDRMRKSCSTYTDQTGWTKGTVQRVSRPRCNLGCTPVF